MRHHDHISQDSLSGKSPDAPSILLDDCLCGPISLQSGYLKKIDWVLDDRPQMSIGKWSELAGLRAQKME